MWPRLRCTNADFDQILTAINAIRTAANNASSLSWRTILDTAPSGPFTSTPVPALGVIIYGPHVMALRDAMNAALGSAGMPTPGYTDTLTPPNSTVIKAIHVAELQQRAQ